MVKKQIGKTGMEASSIILGTWSMGGDEQWGAKNDDADSVKVILKAFDSGINLIDTAPAYGFGHSEEVVGMALKQLPRDKVLVETKHGIWWLDDEGTFMRERDGYRTYFNVSRRAVMREVEESLKRLGTDYIDIYMVHHQARPPFNTPISETMGALMDLKKEGKIRAIGVSNCSDAQLLEYIKCGQVDVLQESFSMLTQGNVKAHLPICKEHGISFEAYAPLEKGLLSGNLRMDYVIPDATNVRNNVPWFAPERRQKVLDMLDGWKPLCEKYGCNQAALSVAWTANYDPSVFVISGGRKWNHMEGYIEGGKIVLEKADFEKMSKDIDALLAQY